MSRSPHQKQSYTCRCIKISLFLQQAHQFYNAICKALFVIIRIAEMSEDKKIQKSVAKKGLRK